MKMKVWEIAEAHFEEYWKQFGKRCCLHRFTDSKEIHGQLRRQKVSANVGALTKKQPSDYLITFDGLTFFAEVKSCSSETSFSLSALMPGQIKYARKCEAAGGTYRIYIKSEVFKQWYCIEYKELKRLAGTNKSIPWAKLSGYIFEGIKDE